MPAVATVEDVSKLYGRFAALRHVSTTLERGRCYLLLGENGAGKSTLLRVLTKLLRPTLGRVRDCCGLRWGECVSSSGRLPRLVPASAT